MFARILLTFPIVLLLAGCPIDGDKGSSGPAGINCWDTNMNRVNDLAEDVNGDGVYNPQDCIPQSTVLQSQDAVLNHQHFCEAFANLNEYPEGCPSSGHSTPTGTLTKITNLELFDDSNNGYYTCNNPPQNGLLSLEYRPDTKYAYWVLEGGYTANRVIMAKQDVVLNGACSALCQADNKCVASYARYNTNESYDCFTMYHSDTVSSFEYICGIDQFGNPDDARDLCVAGLGVTSRWYSICP